MLGLSAPIPCNTLGPDRHRDEHCQTAQTGSKEYYQATDSDIRMGEQEIQPRSSLLVLSEIHVEARAQMHHGTAEIEHDNLIMKKRRMVERLEQSCHKLGRDLRPLCV